MPSGTNSVSVSIGGVTVSKSVVRNGDHPNAYEITLPAGKSGTLSTRTDDDTGVATLGSGHGITDTDTVDVYWDGGMRYGCDVTSTDSTTVSIDLGAGDNLPAQSTPIVVSKQVEINTAIDGDNIQLICICAEFADTASTAKVHADFQADDSEGTVAEIDLTANVPKVWDVIGGSDNPFSGDPIVVCAASNGSSTASATLKILSLEDSTP